MGQSRQPPKFGGRRCERGSAAARDCSRLVETRSGACFFDRVQVRWTQVCVNGRSQKRCRAVNSGLKPMRVPHMARSIAGEDRASEQQDASDVSPMQSMTGCRAQWRDSDKAATEDSKDCNRSGRPESRSCDVCHKALTMVAMRTPWKPPPTVLPHPDLHRRRNVSWALEVSRGSVPESPQQWHSRTISAKAKYFTVSAGAAYHSGAGVMYPPSGADAA